MCSICAAVAATEGGLVRAGISLSALVRGFHRFMYSNAGNTGTPTGAGTHPSISTPSITGTFLLTSTHPSISTSSITGTFPLTSTHPSISTLLLTVCSAVYALCPLILLYMCVQGSIFPRILASIPHILSVPVAFLCAAVAVHMLYRAATAAMPRSRAVTAQGRTFHTVPRCCFTAEI